MQNRDDDLLQIRGQLFNLTNQVEQMQWEVARLLKETQASNYKVNALTRHLLDAEAQKPLRENLAEFLTQMETSQEKLDDLTKTVKKLSRTQFKANTLSESKEEHVSETLALLRELATKREELREAQQAEEQQRIAELQVRARGELAADFLPILDGIEMALAHTIPVPQEEESLQQEEPAQEKEQQEEEEYSPDEKVNASPGFFKRLFRGKTAATTPEVRTSESQTSEKVGKEEFPERNPEIHNTIAGWLRGLEIVRDRFLRLLAREGIEPIPDLYEQFDPHFHVAVETEERSDVSENTIVTVIRRGYTHKDRVLRYSEVIVAKSPKEQAAAVIDEEDFLATENPEKAQNTENLENTENSENAENPEDTGKTEDITSWS